MSLTSELEELIAFLAPLAAVEKEKVDETKPATSRQWRALAENLDDARQALADAAEALEVAAGTGNDDETDKTHRELRFVTGAESARDREQWVEDLRDRARIYAKRAPSDRTRVPADDLDAAKLSASLAEAAAEEAEAEAKKADLKTAENRRKAAAADLRAKELAASTAHLEELRAALAAAKESVAQADVGDDAAALTERADDLRRRLEQAVEAIASNVDKPKVKRTEKTGWEAANLRLTAAQSGVESARQKLGEHRVQDALSRSFTQDLDLEAEMILVLRRRLEGVARRG